MPSKHAEIVSRKVSQIANLIDIFGFSPGNKIARVSTFSDVITNLMIITKKIFYTNKKNTIVDDIRWKMQMPYMYIYTLQIVLSVILTAITWALGVPPTRLFIYTTWQKN